MENADISFSFPFFLGTLLFFQFMNENSMYVFWGKNGTFGSFLKWGLVLAFISSSVNC